MATLFNLDFLYLPRCEKERKPFFRCDSIQIHDHPILDFRPNFPAGTRAASGCWPGLNRLRQQNFLRNSCEHAMEHNPLYVPSLRLFSWETAQDIAAVKAPGVQKNATPSLTQRQAIALLEAIPTDSVQGLRDLVLMSVFFLTGCRVSAVTAACVGYLETDGVDDYLNVTEKRNRKRRKILLDAARPVLAYVAQAGIRDDRQCPLFRPLSPDGLSLVRRHLDRKTPWRLVKKYCEPAGIDPSRLGSRGIGIHSIRKTAINDAIRNGATMHEVPEFAGHADIRTTEVYFIRKEEDAEVAARKIQIRRTGRKVE
jgi:integrase